MPRLAAKPKGLNGAAANKYAARKHVPQNVPGLWLRGNVYWFQIRTGGRTHGGSLRTKGLRVAIYKLDGRGRASGEGPSGLL